MMCTTNAWKRTSNIIFIAPFNFLRAHICNCCKTKNTRWKLRIWQRKTASTFELFESHEDHEEENNNADEHVEVGRSSDDDDDPNQNADKKPQRTRLKKVFQMVWYCLKSR